MIKLNELHKTFESARQVVNALCEINLSVNAGEIYGIIGKSGAGKSTLIRCVNLLEQPTSGEIIIDNVNLTQLNASALREQRKSIGMIFQHFNLLTNKTVAQNIALPLQLTKTPKQEQEKIISELLALTGLSDKKDNYPSQLSGGQKQRVAIARALANKPKVLLCDEATSSLDPQITKSILQLLKKINQEFGLTILLISHEMDVIKQICDKVAVIDQGKIIETAKVTELFAKPQTKIAKALVSNTLMQELPDTIAQTIKPKASNGEDAVLRVFFHGAATSEPLIAHLMQELHLDINILQANVEVIKDETFGTMLVKIKATDEKLRLGLNYLAAKDVHTEVLGYV